MIGYEESEQLDVQPAKYFIVVTKREKRTCRNCAEGVAAAPLPERIIDKALVSDRLIIDTVVDKYSDHLPLFRQSAILQRETGLSVSRAAMDGWVMRVGELLVPVAGMMRHELISDSSLQANETPVPVQREAVKVPSSSSGNPKAYCRPTAILHMKARAAAKWCLPPAGHMHAAKRSMRSS